MVKTELKLIDPHSIAFKEQMPNKADTVRGERKTEIGEGENEMFWK